MVERMAALFAVSALFIAGCDLRPRPYPSVFGNDGCRYQDSTYSHDSTVCQSGTQYRCDDGQWRSLAVACTGGGDGATRTAPAGRACLYNGATVATQSTICRSGTTFRCEDGEWRNLGSTCQ
ncbi:MAG: hypothetical protein H6Q33_3702 [Deltaproteobacteria bacterium]|nr:hypothetical protein [Deltaproteobacteria bacterium]